MFTGLVRERGRIAADPEPSPQGGVRLRVRHSAALGELLSVGASLAVSGVCLTVIELRPEESLVELSPETLRRTTLGALRAGSEVNLEPALRMGDALGGHWVQGHVDGTVAVVSVETADNHREVSCELPADLAPFVVEKGSIALDGVSLTVASLGGDAFGVALIPHTLEVTTLGGSRAGDRLNVEVDLLGKYVHRALQLRGLA
ncbi:MAG TPA: riboflavin synthase [Thermoanaerobaculia bacterium]|jgi:riboflavin synthase|nr:riboflavin synthase [Thermoanaerobaculia bacterium]